MSLDGGRFKTVVPDIGFIRNFGEDLFYDCYQRVLLKFYLEQLINSIDSPISPDDYSCEKFMNNECGSV